MVGTSVGRDAKLGGIEIAWESVYKSATRLRIARETLSSAVKAHERQFRIGFDPRQADRDFLLDSALRDDEAIRYGTNRLSDERAYGVGAVSKTWTTIVLAVAALRGEYHAFFQAFARHRQALQDAAEEVVLERRFERNVHSTCDEALAGVGDGQIHADQKAVLDAIQRDGHGFDFSLVKMKSDRETVDTVIRDSFIHMDTVKDELRNDRAITQEAVQRFAFVGGNDTLLAKEQLPRTLETLSSNVEHVFRSQDLIDELQNWDELTDIVERRRQDRAYMLAAVKVTGQAYEFAPEYLKEDRDITFEAVKQHWPAIRFVPDRLLKDAEIIFEAVKQDGRAYEYADSWLRQDKPFALRCMKENGCALEFVTKKLRNDFFVVMQAIKTFPRAIAWASKELRANKVLVREAVSRDFKALGSTADECRRDMELAMIAVKQSWTAIELLHPDLLDTMEIALEAVGQSWRAVQYLGKNVRASYALAVIAVKQDARAISYFDKAVKKNPKLYVDTGLTKMNLARVAFQDSSTAAAPTRAPFAYGPGRRR